MARSKRRQGSPTQCVRTYRLALLLNLVAAAADAAPGDVWPQWQADALHSGAIHGSLLVAQRHFAWSAQARPYAITGMVATAAYVVTTDTIQTQPYGGSVASVGVQDITTGKTVWSVTFDANVSTSAPSCADGMVFLIENQYVSAGQADTRFLDAFDLATGALLYHQPLAAPGATLDAPTIANGHVYFESQVDPEWYVSNRPNTFGSASEATGVLEWQSNSASGDGIMPAVTGGTLYGATTTLNLLDASGGQTIASYGNPADTMDSSSSNAPAIVGNLALIVQNGALVAFDLSDGTVAWSIPGYGFGHVSTDGHDVFYLAASALSVRDAASGNLLWGWEAPAGGPVEGGALSENMIVTDSHVILTDGVKTYFIDRTTHMSVASYSIAGVIAYAADRLLIGDGGGIVTAIAVPTDELFSDSFE